MYRKYDTNFQVWTDADLISSFGVLHNLSMQAEAKIADILNLPKYKKKKSTYECQALFYMLQI